MADFAQQADVQASISAAFAELPDTVSFSEPDQPVTAEPTSAAQEASSEPPQQDGRSAEAPPAQSTPTDSSPVAESPRSSWADLQAKYGGDPEKAARAYWDTNNRAAQLARENEELKQRLQQPATPTAPQQAPPAEQQTAPEQPQAQPSQPPVPTSADVAALDTQLRTLTTAKEQYEGWRTQYANLRQQAQQEIQKLTRQIALGVLDFDAEEQAKGKLRTLVQQHDEFAGHERTLGAELRDLDGQATLLEIKRDKAASVAEANARREAEIRAEQNRRADTFAAAFFQSIPAIAKDGEPVPADLLPDFHTYAQQAALSNAQRLGQMTPEQVPAFLKETKASFMRVVNAAKKAGQVAYTTAKSEDVAVQAPDGKKAVAPEKKRGFGSRDELEAHLNAAWNGV